MHPAPTPASLPSLLYWNVCVRFLYASKWRHRKEVSVQLHIQRDHLCKRPALFLDGSSQAAVAFGCSLFDVLCIVPSNREELILMGWTSAVCSRDLSSEGLVELQIHVLEVVCAYVSPFTSPTFSTGNCASLPGPCYERLMYWGRVAQPCLEQKLTAYRALTPCVSVGLLAAPQLR